MADHCHATSAMDEHERSWRLVDLAIALRELHRPLAAEIVCLFSTGLSRKSVGCVPVRRARRRDRSVR